MIVLASGAGMRATAADDAPMLFAFPYGRNLRVVSHYQDWVEVTDPKSAATGWMKEAEVSPIAPPGTQPPQTQAYDEQPQEEQGGFFRRRHGGFADMIDRGSAAVSKPILSGLARLAARPPAASRRARDGRARCQHGRCRLWRAGRWRGRSRDEHGRPRRSSCDLPRGAHARPRSAPRRSGCRAPYAPSLLGHRRERVVRIELGVRVGLDLADDALQMEPSLADDRQLARDIRRVARVERDRQLKRQIGAAVTAVFDAEEAPLQGMHVFDRHGTREPEQHGHQRTEVDAAGIGAADDRLEVVVGVVDVPRRSDRCPPILPASSWGGR